MLSYFTRELQTGEKAVRIAATLARSDGIILVSSLIILVALTSLAMVVANTTTSDIRFSSNYHDAKQAYYAAEAGIILALQETVQRPPNLLLKGPDEIAGTSDDGQYSFACCGTQVALDDGTSFRVTVTDDRDDDPDDPTEDTNGQVFLRSEGSSALGSRWVMRSLVRRVCMEGSDGNMRAAVTSNGPINSKGNLIIDGRDHDLDGNVIPGEGTLGISTLSTYERDGASTVGGTDTTVFPAVDIAPRKVGIENIIEENAAWEPPLTPEDVIGLDAATLKTIAQSGYNGSQYVTDPAEITLPVSGVTYVEMPDCGIWNPAEVVGEGVLVVHDEETCSVVKNFHALSYFNGILIVDDLIHLDGNGILLGAIYVLTQTPSEGNCIGNGTLDVLFSHQAIDNALASIATCNMEVLSWSYD